ncbi:MAG TPA: aldo/keto reductase, partial [Thermoanaerobaculia bacterium]|nr:aldo/keto reductase [Thermoanaerobaculia bacterium]
MQKRRLGATARSVFPVGLGCMGLSWAYRDPSVDEAAAIDLVRQAIDLGVDHLDTSDAYGPFTNER